MTDPYTGRDLSELDPHTGEYSLRADRWFIREEERDEYTKAVAYANRTRSEARQASNIRNCLVPEPGVGWRFWDLTESFLLELSTKFKYFDYQGKEEKEGKVHYRFKGKPDNGKYRYAGEVLD